MLSMQEFQEEIVKEFTNEFGKVEIINNMVVVGKYPITTSIPFKSIYQEYMLFNDVRQVLDGYKQVVIETLETYSFSICLENIYPIIKKNTFGLNEDIEFLRTPLYANLQKLYISDMGQCFRFVTLSDNVEVDMIEKMAIENIKKMSAVISPLDKNLGIYTFRHSTDYASSLWCSSTMQKKVERMVGQDYIFMIPSNSCVLFAKNSFDNQDTIYRLAMLDNDVNRVSQDLYQKIGDEYSIFHPSKEGIKRIK